MSHSFGKLIWKLSNFPKRWTHQRTSSVMCPLLYNCFTLLRQSLLSTASTFKEQVQSDERMKYEYVSWSCLSYCLLPLFQMLHSKHLCCSVHGCSHPSHVPRGGICGVHSCLSAKATVERLWRHLQRTNKRSRLGNNYFCIWELGTPQGGEMPWSFLSSGLLVVLFLNERESWN